MRSAIARWFRQRWYRIWYAVASRFPQWLRSPAEMTLGQWGELQARRHLLCAGYQVVGTNVRCRSGEIDIVAVDGPCLVFVEVKTLCDACDDDFPSDRVDKEKELRLSMVAAEYRYRRRLTNVPGRLDVIAVWARSAAQGGWQLDRLRHYQNAFESAIE